MRKKRPPRGVVFLLVSLECAVEKDAHQKHNGGEQDAGANLGGFGFVLILGADGVDEAGGEKEGQNGHNEDGDIGDVVHRAAPFGVVWAQYSKRGAVCKGGGSRSHRGILFSRAKKVCKNARGNPWFPPILHATKPLYRRYPLHRESEKRNFVGGNVVLPLLL